MSTDHYLACRACKKYLDKSFRKDQAEALNELLGSTNHIEILHQLYYADLLAADWIPFAYQHSNCWEGLFVFDEYNMNGYSSDCDDCEEM